MSTHIIHQCDRNTGDSALGIYVGSDSCGYAFEKWNHTMFEFVLVQINVIYLFSGNFYFNLLRWSEHWTVCTAHITHKTLIPKIIMVEKWKTKYKTNEPFSCCIFHFFFFIPAKNPLGFWYQSCYHTHILHVYTSHRIAIAIHKARVSERTLPITVHSLCAQEPEPPRECYTIH